MRMCGVCIVTRNRQRFKYAAMNARLIFAIRVTGATNFKPIMRFGSVIAAMLSTAVVAMRWISVTIVPKSFVPPAAPCFRASFAVEAFVKNVPQRADGTYYYYYCLYWCASG
jgi:hypothetical protein